ncbi:MAG: hypothetical protein NT154_02720 [Verrucomicrobia bacterium]|nr:hypothetical protein [Verrucomicrobiota bacterium]
MRAWRTIFAVAIATLWVAAGAHCRLEVLPGLEFLSCCQHTEAEKTPAHHEKDCGDDGCATIELGFYKVSKQQVSPVKPLLAFVAWLVPSPGNWQASASDPLVSIAPSPPELVPLWQFLQRTALPPRAPSLAS